MNIPKRKIEKPETLEEAYKLIESMRNTATKYFFRFLREGNLEGVKDQYKIGADIYGREEKTDLTCLEVVAEEKAKLFIPVKKKKKEEVSSSLTESANIEYNEFLTIERWLRINGADAGMMFYLLAKNEDKEGIIRNSERYSINACDENGHTAVDIALMTDQFEAAKLLYECGGVMNNRSLKTNERLLESIRIALKDSLSLPGLPGRWNNHKKFLLTAIAVGLPLNTEVEVSLYVNGDHKELCCTLFTAAILKAKYDIVEACLERGANVNGSMDFWLEDGYGYPVVKVSSSCPWELLCTHGKCKKEELTKFKNLFVSYGARIQEDD